MGVWTAHNPVRYALIFADGPGIMFEFKFCEHLNDGLEAVDEVRPAIGWNYMFAGDRVSETAGVWADEIADLVRTHGGGNRRLAVDRMETEGFHALEARGISVIEGGQIFECARAIKSAGRDRTDAVDDPRLRGGHGAHLRAFRTGRDRERTVGASAFSRTPAPAVSGWKPNC